jgi:hypothetical protein
MQKKLRKTEKGRRNLERYRKGKGKKEKEGNSEHKETTITIGNKRKYMEKKVERGKK